MREYNMRERERERERERGCFFFFFFTEEENVCGDVCETWDDDGIVVRDGRKGEECRNRSVVGRREHDDDWRSDDAGDVAGRS